MHRSISRIPTDAGTTRSLNYWPLPPRRESARRSRLLCAPRAALLQKANKQTPSRDPRRAAGLAGARDPARLHDRHARSEAVLQSPHHVPLHHRRGGPLSSMRSCELTMCHRNPRTAWRMPSVMATPCRPSHDGFAATFGVVQIAAFLALLSALQHSADGPVCPHMLCRGSRGRRSARLGLACLQPADLCFVAAHRLTVCCAVSRARVSLSTLGHGGSKSSSGASPFSSRRSSSWLRPSSHSRQSHPLTKSLTSRSRLVGDRIGPDAVRHLVGSAVPSGIAGTRM